MSRGKRWGRKTRGKRGTIERRGWRGKGILNSSKREERRTKRSTNEVIYNVSIG